MRCDDVRISLSALLDGEEPLLDQSIIRVHLQRCTRCRSFAMAIEELDRHFRPPPRGRSTSNR